MVSRLKGLSLALAVASVLAIAPTQTRAQQSVELNRIEDHVDVIIRGRPFTTFYFSPQIAKPYLSPLRSAQGTIVTRGFPMDRNIPGEDHDEPHQRAMYFAHGDINGYDFWARRPIRDGAGTLRRPSGARFFAS